MSIINSIHNAHIRYIIADPPPAVHFVTFANTSFMQPTRILEEATAFNFASIRHITEHDIPEFIETHKDFISQNPLGYGFWIWKPKVILDSLLRLDKDEVLLYCDAGFHLNKNGLPRYREYLRLLKNSDIVTFATSPNYTAQQFVKRDAVDSYYPMFAYSLNEYCYAGIMLVRNTDAAVRLLKDWLMLCETHRFIDKSFSSVESRVFVGNDCDNGLFNLCLQKHKISVSVDYTETNIYDENGVQIHAKDSIKWDELSNFPFQCRRLRPAREYHYT